MNLESKVRQILKGIDETECETDDGWWETSTGANFGKAKLEELIKLLNPCWCHTCRPITLDYSNMRMVLCPDCGNKRCPKATDHRLECTNSNEPDQEGSIY